MLAVLFYNVVLAAHIAAVVIAFGVTFTYPLTYPFTLRRHPRAMPALHETQGRVGKFIIMPAAAIALLLGAYLVSDRHYWSETWVIVPLIILVVLLGLGGAFFGPQEERARELAERDIAAAGAGEVTFSPEYEAISRRVAMVGGLANLLILTAVFFMTAKPFA
jgi:uncharacterized membrane protein